MRNLCIRRSRSYKTFLIEWDTDRPRCIIGLTGLDRPSVQWHFAGWLGRRKLAREEARLSR